MLSPRSTLSLVSPAVNRPAQSEAQVLGAMAWLLMHSPQHRQLPLHMLGTLVLPPVKAGQYLLLSESGPSDSAQKTAPETPVACVAWANLSAQAEACYLSDHLQGLQPDEWSSGDRMWFIHWVAPFGHTQALRRLVLEHIPNFCARALHHRGMEHGLRVNTFRGKHVTAQTARQWWRERPMLAATPAAATTAGANPFHNPDTRPHL